MNYALGKLILQYCFYDCFNKETVKSMNYQSLSAIDGVEFIGKVEGLFKLYSPEVNLGQMNIMTSHDTPRILNLASKDTDSVKQALFLMFCLPGAPTIYYGDEVGVTGDHDPDCRKGFPWNKEDWNKDLYHFNQDIIALRKKEPALQKGEFKTVQVEGDLLHFERNYAGETLHIILNRSKGPFDYKTEQGTKSCQVLYKYGVDKSNNSFDMQPKSMICIKLLS